MAGDSWKAKRDSLYRGDKVGGVALPCPRANLSIVRHILYLEGYGRETPYLSVTETREAAFRFSGTGGTVYTSQPADWQEVGVKHRSRKELLLLLRKKGKGDAQWNSAFEVLRAHQYVQESQEHLADFRDLSETTDQELQTILPKMFTES